MGLININTLVGENGLFAKRGCPGNCQHCNLWTKDGCRVILEAPTVDAVEVVHGRWLSAYEYALKLGVTDKEKLEETKKDKWWKFCNSCEQPVKGFHNYCPNCGAKMDGTK